MGISGIFYVMRIISMVTGYFDSGKSPLLKLCRLNVVSLLCLISEMGSVLIGTETLSLNLLCLMMANLADVYFASTYESR
jgi:hypothetical protein